jgi:transcriptional regulator of heat shock response
MTNIMPKNISIITSNDEIKNNNEPEIRSIFDINLIKSTVNDIKATLDKLKDEGSTDNFDNEIKILELYPEFYDSYPFLVKKLCKNSDMDILYKMLEQLEQVENGNKTLNNVELSLGKELADQYLYPNINN